MFDATSTRCRILLINTLSYLNILFYLFFIKTRSLTRRVGKSCDGQARVVPMSDSAARPVTAAWHVFAAAGVAAAVELSIMQPLDVVKTRLQLQGSQLATADRYSGTWHALRSIHAAEGAAGLWRGFGTGLAIVIPRRGLKFAFNDFFRSVLQPRRGATERPSFHCNLAAGGLAGACEAVLVTPLEVIKVVMHSEPSPSPNPGPSPSPNLSPNPSPNPNPNPKA